MQEYQEFAERVGTDAPPAELRPEQFTLSGPSPLSVAESARKPVQPRSWSLTSGLYFGADQTYATLPAGVYKCGAHPHFGPFLAAMPLHTDDLLLLPDSATGEILVEFQRFWASAEEFRRRGFVHKRGFQFWGPPGSGKTAFLSLLSEALVRDYDGVVLFLYEPSCAVHCMRLLRTVEPTRPLVVLMEDIDALVARYGESEFLAMLDGQNQVGGVVFAATTNYPERLDRRFYDRPSRFDTIRYIGMPSEQARCAYLRAREPSLVGEELARWVAASEGLSIAHLKEMVVAVRCLGHEFGAVVGRLEAMRQRPSSAEEPSVVKVGFRRGGGRL